MNRLVFITLLAALSACSPAEQVPSGHGRTGVGDAPNSLHRIAWKVVTESELGGAPAISSAGIGFVNSGGTVRVVEPKAGDEVWKLQRDAPIWAEPAWAGSRLVIGDDLGRVACLDVETKSETWETELTGPVEGGILAEQGVAYAGTADGAVTALALDDGRPLWETRLTASVTSRLAYHDDLLVFGGSDGAVHGVSAITGESEFGIRCGDAAVTLVAADTSNVFSACGARVMATSGKKAVWKTETDSPVSGGIAVGDDTVYVGTEGGLVLAFDRSTGEERWRFQTDSPVWGPMALGSTMVFAADHAGIVRGLDRASGEEGFVFKAESRTLSGVVANAGRLYFGDVDGNLYAIE